VCFAASRDAVLLSVLVWFDSCFSAVFAWLFVYLLPLFWFVFFSAGCFWLDPLLYWFCLFTGMPYTFVLSWFLI
jgi:hypothetical protein